MRRPSIIFIMLTAILVVSCRKEDSVDRGKYPRVDESELQGVIRTNLDSPAPTKAQLARRSQSIAIIKAMGLPVMENLPVVEDQLQVKPRTPREVAERHIAVVLCALKGETEGKDNALVDSA